MAKSKRKSSSRRASAFSGAGKQRAETDSMGSMMVPLDALFGATTQRAVLNFPVSGRALPPQVIAAYLELKRAAAMANTKLHELPRAKANAIVDACHKLLEDFADRRAEVMRHFPLDVFQTGSGTSTNMNVNEVIANTASVMAGKPIGSRDPLHPNDHVNYGQSSNDTFPSAMQIAGAVEIQLRLIPALKALHKALDQKARAWDKFVKIGRTHLMDATPVRVGQEFSGFAAAVALGVQRAERARDAMARNLPIGGTAVGTGINTHPRFAREVCATLSKDLGVKFTEASNHFEAQSTRDCVVEASGLLKTIAVSLSKIANDIRWMGSGPRCGLGELTLPATQPGSSIMPGKVNPVICESVMQVACRVVGNDASITLGGFGGVGSLLELNVAMPLIADDLLESILLLANVCDTFTEKCIAGLELHPDAMRTVERSLMMVTSLAPVIGYDNAARVAK
jgi:fumarate hydratase class II